MSTLNQKVVWKLYHLQKNLNEENKENNHKQEN